MRLTELHLRSLPGLEQPVTLDLSADITLVHGPNGSGKSSLCRAVWSLLWPAPNPARPFSVAADFLLDGRRLAASRVDTDPVVWAVDGQPGPGPSLPADHVAASYHLNMLDLVRQDAGPVDKALAQELKRLMAGGYDLDETAALFQTAPRAGHHPRNALTAARQKVMEIHARHAALAGQEADLERLEAEREEAGRAAGRLVQLDRLIQRVRRQADFDSVRRQINDLPPGLADLQADDLRQLTDGRREARTSETDLTRQTAEIAALETRLAELAPPPNAAPVDLPAAAGFAERLQTLQTQLDTVERTLAGAGALVDADTGPTVDPAHYRQLAALHADLVTGDSRRQAAEMTLRDLDREAMAGRRTWLWIGIGGGLLIALAGVLGLSLPSPLSLLTAGPTLLGGLGLLVLAGRRQGAGAVMHRRQVEMRRSAEDQLAALADSRRATLADLADLGTVTGLDLADPRPELLHHLKALALGQDAAALAQKTAAERDTLLDQIQTALAGLNTQLENAGLPAAVDPATARQRLASLQDREQTRDHLTDTLRQARSAQDLTADQLTRVLDRIRTLLTRLKAVDHPDPDAQVRALADLADTWTELTDEAAAARRDLARLDQELARDHAALDPAQMNGLALPELERQADDTRVAAGGADDLLREITTIQTRIKAARQGHELEAAMAEEAAALANLSQERDAQRDDALARLLLDQVRQQNEMTTRPALLQTAMDLLFQFTDNRYRLLVDTAAGQIRFRAEDTDRRQVLELSELSDGTRAQLLLAVRLAFITRAEDGLPLPLFLDDSLTASDPVRFDAIAGGLAAIAAAQNRQIIYLTPSPADVAAWQRALAQRGLPSAREIDLGEMRSLGAAATDLKLTDLPAVPGPDGRDAAAYGKALAVPGADPWQPAEALHLFHLLRDDLPLLHRLLEAGVPTVGRWQVSAAPLQRAGLVTAVEAGKLAGRIQVWRSVLDGWRVGRGWPVTREILQGSDALSAAMLPKVLNVLEVTGHGASDFMAALHDGAARGLRQDKKSQLQDYLELAGCLDSRPILDADGLQAQVLSSVATAVRRRELDAMDVRSLVHQLAAALNGDA